MNHRKILRVLGLALATSLVALLTYRTTSAQLVDPGDPVVIRVKGPCLGPVGVVGDPGGCETECVVYCTDPCSTIDWVSGATCAGKAGPCRRSNQSQPSEICTECECVWPFGGCVNSGPYPSGSTSVLSCS